VLLCGIGDSPKLNRCDLFLFIARGLAARHWSATGIPLGTRPNLAGRPAPSDLAKAELPLCCGYLKSFSCSRQIFMHLLVAFREQKAHVTKASNIPKLSVGRTHTPPTPPVADRQRFELAPLAERRPLRFFTGFGITALDPAGVSPMRARIYQPARTAMQSGSANLQSWVLEFAPASAREVDPLMGWTSSSDTEAQVRLRFVTREAAENYAKAQGISYDLQEPKPRKPVIRPRGYGENFATDRKGAWTH